MLTLNLDLNLNLKHPLYRPTAQAKLESDVRAHYAAHSAGAGGGLDAAGVRGEYESIKAQVRHGGEIDVGMQIWVAA